MLDIGWPELFIIGVVTLLVVGPKELPKVLKTVSALVRRARSLASEFQRGVDEMVRESEIAELKKGLTDVSDPSIIERFADEVDEDRSIRKALEPAEELKAPMERPSKKARGVQGKPAPAHSVTPPADPFETGVPETPEKDAATADTPSPSAAPSDSGGETVPRQDEGNDGPDEKPKTPTVSGGASASG